MKKHFLTGLIILTPVVITLFAIGYLLNLFTMPFASIVGHLLAWTENSLSLYISPEINLILSRLFSFLLILALIFLLGMLGRWFFIRGVLKLTTLTMERIPVINTIYKTTRDIFSALFSTDGKKVFKEPVMVTFPDPPNFCVGFKCGEAPKECEEKIGHPLVAVFAPTAPHPISGFIFLVPENETHPLNMTNEDAIKFLVSCGVILPASETEHLLDDPL